MTIHALILVFLVGLAGSIHCAGMCGGFVVAISQMDRTRHPILRQAAYHAGKTATYATMGAVSGAVGAAVSGLFVGLQNVLSVALGFLLVAVGAWLLGLVRIRYSSPIPFASWLANTLGRLVRIGTPSAVFALGMLNGLLPCALVYAMLATSATTGSVLGGMLTMTAFGLATVPVLLAVGLSVRFARPLWRMRLSRLAGGFVIVLGVITVFRGLPLAQHVMHDGHERTEAVHDAASGHRHQ